MRRLLPAFFLFFLACAFLAPALPGAPLPARAANPAAADGAVLVRLRAPARAPQGSAVRVVASVPGFAPGADPVIVFAWEDKSVRAAALPAGDRREAEMLVPVPVNAGKSLVVRATAAASPDGPQTAQARIGIDRVAWPEQQISVSKKYVSPPRETLRRIEAERKRSREALARITPERAWSGAFVRPVPGAVTSPFGGRRMFNGELRSSHRGVDLRGAQGTPIKALAAGEVVLAEPMYYSGNVVYLDHGQGVISIYCHMSAIDVRPGDRVDAGQTLGKVGATGRVTGPHLHLGLVILGQAVDPLSLFAPEGDSTTSVYLLKQAPDIHGLSTPKQRASLRRGNVMAAKKNTGLKNMSFEERLRRLQEVVAALENGGGGTDGELPLEESVRLYKEGLALSRACREQLDKVRNEVRLLAEDGSLEPFPDRDGGADCPAFPGGDDPFAEPAEDDA